MKKVLKSILFICLFFIGINFVSAKEATLYFFYGQGCPHCADEKPFLDEMEKKYKDLTIKRYEVWYDEDNQKLMQKMAKDENISAERVPFTLINGEYFFGYSTTYATKLENMIKKAIEYKDPIIEGTSNDPIKEDNNIFDLPLIGKVNVKKVSLGLMAMIIGLVDGFNPCAMWVLIFLITMLIGMKDRKKMWILGLGFILTSAIVYLLIMMSWLEIVVNIGMTVWIRNIIAGVAIVGSIINLRGFFKSKDNGCTVVDDKKRSKTFEKIKKFAREKNLFLALLGVIGLAISVNLIELVCSAGLPIIFTQILALNEVGTIGSLLYTLLYILFFLLDDLIIFIIAMITLKVSGISTKYTKYSHLIGGIIMLIIGLLLIFKPEWIMFNF